MPSYTLTYFGLRGLAETTRLMFAYADVPYEDKRITKDEWPAMKPTMPTGTLPVLTVDGKNSIGQSGAINRYLARQFGMNGKDDCEATCIDMYAGCIDDLAQKLRPVQMAMFGGDKEGAKKAFAEANEKDVQPLLSILEKQITKNGKGFLVGDKPSYADFMLQTRLHGLIEFEKSAVESHPKLMEYYNHISGLKGVKEWIAKRPETAF